MKLFGCRAVGLRWAAAIVVSAGLVFAQDDLDKLFRQGVLALEAGKYAESIALLERVVEADSSHIGSWLGLADAYRKAGRDGDAEGAISRAEDAAQENPWIFSALAMYFAEQKEFSQAADYQARFARAFEDEKDVFLNTARYYLEAGRPDHAAEFAWSGLERTPGAGLYNVLGRSLARLGRAAEAEEALKKAVELSPYEEEFAVSLARFYLRARRFEEAAAACNLARKTFDKSPQLETALGIAQWGQGRSAEALDALLRAARLDPKTPDPYFYLVDVIAVRPERLPEFRERAEAFSRAQPEHFLGPYLRARALEVSGTASDEAVEVARESIEREPGFWKSHVLLARLLAARGSYEESVVSLRRAGLLAPGEPAIQAALAGVHKAMKNRQAARDAERRAKAMEARTNEPPAVTEGDWLARR